MQIAITGSKGKSTVLSIIEKVLIETNKSVVSFKSVDGVFYNGEKVREVYDASLDDYLKYDRSYDFQLSEATSKMLSRGIYLTEHINIGVYTGIEKTEHLETHGNFSSYLKAKKTLFDLLQKNSVGIVNSDCSYYREIIRDTKATIITYGFSQDSDCIIKIQNLSDTFMHLIIHYKNTEYSFEAKLLGTYNASNIAASFLVCKSISVLKDSFLSTIQNFDGFPGRYERVSGPNDNIVVIDYAHSANSLKNVILLTKKIYPSKKIVTVFGCGGNKSRVKRPLMGEIASKLSDYVYLTDDNPRYEDPHTILKDIENGIKKNEGRNYKIISNRFLAIKRAVYSHKSAVVIIAGKGREDFIRYYDKKLRLADREILRQVSNNILVRYYFLKKYAFNLKMIKLILYLYSKLYK